MDGKKCFIIGGGPSLENFDFNQIKDHFTIGVNKAFISFPVDIIYMMDTKFYQYLTTRNATDSNRCEIQKLWQNFKGRKILLGAKHRKLKVNIETIKRIKEPCLSLDVNSGIYGGSNSGFGALTLAIAMGYKKIYLLGFDLKCEEKTHWHTGYSEQNLKRQQRKVKKFKKIFEKFSSIINENGIEVFNVNLDSDLNCFPKIDIKRALE